MFRKQLSPLRWQSVILMMALMLLSAMALATTDWADHLTLIPLVVMIGVVTGALIGHSRVGSILSTLMILAHGVFITGWLYGWTLNPAYTMHEKALVLLGRIRIFLSVVTQGLANQDPLPVVMVLAFAFWIFASVGTLRLVRHRELLGAVAPAGIALVVVVHFYIGPNRLSWMLGLYVACALMLALDSDLAVRESTWRARGARIAPQTIGPVLRAGAIVLISIVLLSWAGPAFARSEVAAEAWDQVSTPFSSVRERIADALSSFRSAATVVSDEFGDSLTLEAGTEPSDELIMEVAPVGQLLGSGRFYWRARVHDSYSRSEWTDTERSLLEYDPRRDPPLVSDDQARERIELNFVPISSIQHILYLPSSPVSVNRSAEYDVIPGSGSPGDITAMYAGVPVFPGEVYRAQADISVATADQLRAADEIYPDWVLERYLQIPSDVTDRTLELAELIAGNQPTAYDKAAAITTWLRRNIEYQRVTPPPPPDRDPIDWFLFDYQTGFCNYYASAEVIMLRSLGVPARLAVGYARGSFQPDQQLYQVHGADYHAWPEVYFPGYGWVEFEPTVSQPPLIRPGTDGAEEDDGSGLAGGLAGDSADDEIDQDRLEELLQEEPPPVAQALESAASGRILLAGAIALAIMAAAVALWMAIDPFWRLRVEAAADSLRKALSLPERSSPSVSRRRTPLSEHIYRAWMQWWPWLGLSASADQTPRERSDLFARIFPESSSQVLALIELYEGERFGPAAVSEEQVRKIWSDLRPTLWLGVLRRAGSSLAAIVQTQAGPPPNPAEPLG